MSPILLTRTATEGSDRYPRVSTSLFMSTDGGASFRPSDAT